MLERNGYQVVFNPYTNFHKFDFALEGTGSIVFSRDKKVAFAASSERTNEKIFHNLCSEYGFRPVYFFTSDTNFKPYYHTNVILSIGADFLVICKEAIHTSCRDWVLGELIRLDKDLIYITQDQVRNFCGNILQLNAIDHISDSIIVMSTTAIAAFKKSEKELLSRYGQIIPIHIPTIERFGGGSARCMIAELFLPKRCEITSHTSQRTPSFSSALSMDI